MTGSEFKIGSVVKLKSGGHKMVIEYIDHLGIATVRWIPVDWEGKPFSGAMLKETINVECLQVVG